MRNAVRILLAAVVFSAVVTISGPAVRACPDGTEIDINYYDATSAGRESTTSVAGATCLTSAH